MEYSAILESYYESLAIEEELDDQIYQIATEADTAASNQMNTGNSEVSGPTNGTGVKLNPNSTGPNDNNPAVTNKLLTVIKEVIDKLRTAVKQALVTIQNRLRKVMISDKGFKSKLRERERSVKPLNAVKVTCYQYMDEYLSNFTNRLKGTMDRVMGDLVKCSDPKNPLPSKDPIGSKGQDQIVSAFLSEVTKKEDLTEINAALTHLQNMYRGQKRETTYKQTDLPNLIRLSEEYPAIQNQISKYINEAHQYVGNMESRSRMLRASGITDAQRKDFLANNNKALKIFNAYKTILNFIFELRVEKAMNYRVIVQKFYQF